MAVVMGTQQGGKSFEMAAEGEVDMAAPDSGSVLSLVVEQLIDS